MGALRENKEGGEGRIRKGEGEKERGGCCGGREIFCIWRSPAPISATDLTTKKKGGIKGEKKKAARELRPKIFHLLITAQKKEKEASGKKWRGKEGDLGGGGEKGKRQRANATTISMRDFVSGAKREKKKVKGGKKARERLDLVGPLLRVRRKGEKTGKGGKKRKQRTVTSQGRSLGGGEKKRERGNAAVGQTFFRNGITRREKKKRRKEKRRRNSTSLIRLSGGSERGRKKKKKRGGKKKKRRKLQPEKELSASAFERQNTPCKKGRRTQEGGEKKKKEKTIITNAVNLLSPLLARSWSRKGGQRGGGERRRERSERSSLPAEGRRIQKGRKRSSVAIPAFFYPTIHSVTVYAMERGKRKKKSGPLA